MASLRPAATGGRGGGLADLARLQAIKLQVFARRWWLDEELASGLDPRSRPTLALRACQLVRPRYRRQLARSVERLVREFDAGPRRWLSPALPFRRNQVAEARPALILLAYALRAVERAQPRGAAMVSKLLRDSESPLYTGSAPGALQLRAQAALDCLLVPRQTRPEARR